MVAEADAAAAAWVDQVIIMIIRGLKTETVSSSFFEMYKWRQW